MSESLNCQLVEICSVCDK